MNECLRYVTERMEHDCPHKCAVGKQLILWHESHTTKKLSLIIKNSYFLKRGEAKIKMKVNANNFVIMHSASMSHSQLVELISLLQCILPEFRPSGTKQT